MLSIAAELATNDNVWAISQAGADVHRWATGCGDFGLPRESRRRFEPSIRGGVAVLPLVGPTTHHATALTEFLGGVALTEFGRQFDDLVGRDAVRAIVLEIDSDGGEYFGVPELAAKIYHARGSKRIVAAINSTAGSGAYWIASAADEVAITPSGDAGSIGVVALHVDRSGANEKEGVGVTYITSGQYKAEGSPDFPLGREARAEIQRRVDQRGRAFVQAVAKYRGKSPAFVKMRFGQGRYLMAQDAVKVGLADRVATLEEIVDGAQDREPARGVRRSRSTAAVHARRLALLRARKAELLEAASRQTGGRVDCPDRLLEIVHGVACPYARTSEVDAAGYVCRFEPWAFAESLTADWNIEAVLEHQGAVVGQTCDGTLRVWDDEQGLRFELHPPANVEGRRLLLRIRRGKVAGVSVRHHVEKSRQAVIAGREIKVIEKARLVHVALVDRPAMPGTTVRVRPNFFGSSD